MNLLKKHFVIIALGGILVSSCGPETPAPQHHYVDKKIPPLNFLIEGEFNLGEPGGGNGSPCPQAGYGCRIPLQMPPITPPNIINEQLTILKSYVSNNNLAGYFSLMANYQVLFPDFQNDSNSLILQGLTDGTYKIAIGSDNAIVIYKNNSLSNENVILVIIV